jgi:hypothetical protein
VDEGEDAVAASCNASTHHSRSGTFLPMRPAALFCR